MTLSFKAPAVGVFFRLASALTYDVRAADPPTGNNTHRRIVELSLRAAIEQALARNFDLRIDRQDGLLAQAQLDSAQAAYVPTMRFGVNWERAEDPLAAGGAGVGTAIGASRTDTVSWTGGVAAQLPSGGSLNFSYNLSGTDGITTLASGARSAYDGARGTLGVVSLTQPLFRGLRIDATRLTIRQRKLDVRSAELTAVGSANDIVAAVEQAYYQLVAARETVKVREAALGLAQRTAADTLARRQIGTVAPLAERQAQAAAATAEADLINARQTVRERENALKLLVSDRFAELRDAEIVPSDPLSSESVSLDYDASLQHALAHRAELGQLDLTIQQRQLGVMYQRDQRRPQVDLVGSYGVSGSAERNRTVLTQWRDRDFPSYAVGVQVSVPWTNKKARSDLRSAETQKRQAELRLEQQRDVVHSQIDTAVANAGASFERIGATRRAREYAGAALAAEQDKLNAGQSTTFNVLQLQRDLTSARANELSALADYNTALATLRQREASTLEHWRITFDPSPASAAALPSPASSSRPSP